MDVVFFDVSAVVTRIGIDNLKSCLRQINAVYFVDVDD